MLESLRQIKFMSLTAQFEYGDVKLFGYGTIRPSQNAEGDAIEHAKRQNTLPARAFFDTFFCHGRDFTGDCVSGKRQGTPS